MVRSGCGLIILQTAEWKVCQLHLWSGCGQDQRSGRSQITDKWVWLGCGVGVVRYSIAVLNVLSAIFLPALVSFTSLHLFTNRMDFFSLE